MSAPVIKFRRAQKVLMRLCEEHRMLGFLARRQYGKTTTFSAIALRKMMKRPNHLVTFASATLLLGRELILKEARVMQQALAMLAANQKDMLLEVADAQSGKAPKDLSVDDFAELFEAQRLEFRLHHGRNAVSRTMVIAPNPETAVGWTGDVMLDEVGRIKRFRELWEAMEPIASSDPTFRLLLCTTPPPDDTHYCFEMLAPPTGTDLPVRAEGNIYRSELGVTVLRVDAYDAYADGVAVYDLEKGEALAPAEHRKRALDKDAWDRNYGVKFVFGGTAAVPLLALDTAQQRGLGKCEFMMLDSDEDIERAADWIRAHVGPGPVGIGWDVATTEKGTSNPSSLAIMEQGASEAIVRMIAIWKTSDPDAAELRARLLTRAVGERAVGGRARRMCIDATNERYFATTMRRKFASELPVELVVGSEKAAVTGEPMTQKQHLGSVLVACLEDNRMTLPASRYIREDFRLVRKERGLFVCEPTPDGMHGDTFDATKLAMKALQSSKGAITSMKGIRIGRPQFTPGRLVV